MSYRQHCTVDDIEDVDFREISPKGDMSLLEGVVWFVGFLIIVGAGVAQSL